MLRGRARQQAVGVPGSGGEDDAAKKLAAQLDREAVAHDAGHGVQVMALVHHRPHDTGRARVHA